MNLFNVPLELRQRKQWLLWKYVQKEEGGKPTKVPCQINGELASVADPSHWATFEEVLTVVSNFAGCGFVFTPADPYLGIDLDATDDPKLREVQQRIYTTFNSYSERSPSGTGLHIICRATVPTGRRRGPVEMYSQNRFFTMTGDQFGDQKEIRDCQGVAEILYNELGGKVEQYHYDGNALEKDTDAQVIALASNASNGDKFDRLLTGEWQGDYSSQSEADFAFIDIIAYYTQNREQIKRIFRASPLGARRKALRDQYVDPMIQKSFDRMLPPLDMDGLYNSIQEQKAEMNAAPVCAEVPVPDASYDPVVLPRGLVGDIAKFIFAMSPLPVQKISLMAALGLVAGISGRAYNVNRTGLNMYLLMLAPTGSGKEAMVNGITLLMSCVSKLGAVEGANVVPSAGKFLGPEELVSSPALYKALAKQPCFLTIAGEFGLRIQAMASERASPNDLQLKRALLSLYNRSGVGNSWGGSVYSDKEKNVDAITSPTLSILAESTPETFYKAMSEETITDGLLPRFLVAEYRGERPELNYNTLEKPPVELINAVGSLCVQAHLLNSNGQPHHVTFTPDAFELAKDFASYCTKMINKSNTEVLRHLWNRAHVKVLKLAALVAVGADMYNPVITREDIVWSYELVKQDVERLTERFQRGEIGHDVGNDTTAQMRDVHQACVRFINEPLEKLKSYGVKENAHSNMMIPHAYLSRFCVARAAFRKDRRGASQALNAAIEDLVKSGILRRFSAKQVEEKLSNTGLHYALLDMKTM